jgi:hypothetical protein
MREHDSVFHRRGLNVWPGPAIQQYRAKNLISTQALILHRTTAQGKKILSPMPL